MVLPNVTMEPSDVSKKKKKKKPPNVIKVRLYKKRITECDKSTVICDIVIVQCDNETIKYK